MNEIKTGLYKNNEGDFKFEFNVSPSYAKRSEFVNSVVDYIVENNYNYILKDLIFDYMLIKVFTNVNTDYIANRELFVDEVEAIEELVSNTNIVKIIKNNIDFDVLMNLEDAVDKGIEYKTGIHSNPVLDSLANLISSIDDKVNEFNFNSDEMMEIANILMNVKEEFTADKLIEAYARSEFKNKHDDVDE